MPSRLGRFNEGRFISQSMEMSYARWEDSDAGRSDRKRQSRVAAGGMCRRRANDTQIVF